MFIIVKLKCIICNGEFDGIRSSKLTCGIECEKLRKSEYDNQRYLQFRNADRKKRREMLIERYSIVSTNLYKLKYICDGCLNEFYYDYSIYQRFNDTYVSHFNTTEWGSPYCPNCGLVEKSKCDELNPQSHFTMMGETELKLYLNDLSKCKKPFVKSQAIHIRNHIDFIAEAEDVRKRLNRIHNKGDLTPEEINICIAALFRSLK